MAYKPTNLSEDLIRRLDEELARAIAAVDDGKVTKAGVSLSFTVSIDEDAGTESSSSTRRHGAQGEIPGPLVRRPLPWRTTPTTCRKVRR